jgi:hypothetical protein
MDSVDVALPNYKCLCLLGFGFPGPYYDAPRGLFVNRLEREHVVIAAMPSEGNTVA